MNESPVRSPHPRPFSRGEGDYRVACRDCHAERMLYRKATVFVVKRIVDAKVWRA